MWSHDSRRLDFVSCHDFCAEPKRVANPNYYYRLHNMFDLGNRNDLQRMTPLISVIIVTYNSAKWLPRCLESLRAQTIADKIEVVFVDNHSSDECGEWMWVNLIAPFNRINTGSNLGFVANNIGAQHARGKYLFLLNPDTWLHPFCLEQLYLRAEIEKAEMTGAAVANYDSPRIVALGADSFDLAGQPIESHSQRRRDLLAFAGFCFIRRDWFFHIGTLNDALFMYGEEWDLSWRTWLAGGRIVLEPSAVVHHYSGNGTSACKRFLAARNAMVVTACNAQHVLLLTLLPLAALVLLSAFWSSLMRGLDWQWFRRSGLDPFRDLWRLRHKIAEARYCNRTFRKRSDWAMLRFLRLGLAWWPYAKADRERRRKDKELMQTIKRWRTE